MPNLRGKLALAGALAVGLSGTLAGVANAAPAAPTNWHVGVYLPPNYRAVSEGAASTTAAGLATFQFTSQPNTALLLNTQGSQMGNLLGDDAGKTVTATYTISGPSPFSYYGAPDACNTPASARLYFQTTKAGGFDPTQYWWAHTTGAQQLAPGTFTVTTTVTPDQWSDWSGKMGTDSLASAGFAAAAANVTGIGLSFGGGCFFENGVAAPNDSLTLTSFTVG